MSTRSIVHLSIPLVAALFLTAGLFLLLQGTATANQEAISAAISYRGELVRAGEAYSGTCDLAFTLFDAASDGNAIGSPVTVTGVPVTDGVFQVELDFGAGAFDGQERWLAVRVKCAGDADFVDLNPRQKLNAVPYALYSQGGAFWKLSGNAGTTYDANFIGTTDDVSVTLKVSNTTALRLAASQDDESDSAPNLIGGHASNAVNAEDAGNVIAGGGSITMPNTIRDTDFSAVSGGEDNRILDSSWWSVIGGGEGNRIDHESDYSAISGGTDNTITGSDYSAIGGGIDNTIAGVDYGSIDGGEENRVGDGSNYSAIGGGYINIITGSSHSLIAGGENNRMDGGVEYSAIGGGQSNEITDDSDWNVIAGGENNRMDDNVDNSAIGGGEANTITVNADWSVIGGGKGNRMDGGVEYSAIGGGQSNEITDDSDWNIIAGGETNTISNNVDNSAIGGGEGNTITGDSDWSLIAGGDSNHISDGSDASAISGGEANTITDGSDWSTIGGGHQNTVTGVDYAYVAGRRAKARHKGVFLWADSTDADLSSSAENEFLVRASGGITLFTDAGMTTGPKVAPGSGTWETVSDRRLKQNFERVDPQAVLAALVQLPLMTWNYRGQGAEIRHLGPTAQDFAAAFGLGDSDTTISTVDADGVALAAIQGLYELVQTQQELLAQQQTLAQTQQAEIEALKARIEMLEAERE